MDPFKPIADAMYMDIDSNPVYLIPRYFQRQIAHFGTNAGQFDEFLDRIRNVSVILLQQDIRRFLYELHFLGPKTNFADELSQLFV